MDDGFFFSWYEGVYSFLPSVFGDTRREAQIIKAYANNTTLISQHAAHLMVFKISASRNSN